MKITIALSTLLLVAFSASAQTSVKKAPVFMTSDWVKPAMVDFDSYEKLMNEVKVHRKSHLVPLDSFVAMSKRPKVVILDTRSDSMYNAKHITGAIHLNFSDFNQRSLAKLIPDKNTTILIYCNNNFDDDPVFFVTKSVQPMSAVERVQTPLTLALNIPTYINLFGYGYKNVYELSQTISVKNSKITLSGTAVGKVAVGEILNE